MTGFGPWVSGLAEGERVARLREMRALALVFCGPSHPLVSALRRAELDPAAAERALELLDALPALRHRRLSRPTRRCASPYNERRRHDPEAAAFRCGISL
jgi:hypothetical protein